MFKIDFQDGGHGGYPGIPIEISLELFRLQVAPILPTDRNDFCYFKLACTKV